MALVPNHPRLSVTPDVCGGRPCVANTRMRVGDILDMLADGATEAEIVADFPYITIEDVRACLAYASARSGHPIVMAAE
jgi:uncharacterized protein (DUF433 family)